MTTNGIPNEFKRKLFSEVRKQVVGQEEALLLITAALLAQGHVLLEDVPGTGKTTMAKALSQAFQAEFSRVQATPDLLPQDLLGAMIYRPQTGEFELRKGPIFTQFLLFDEINRATPRTASALLEAMAEGQVSIDGRTESLPAPFFVIATQNPIESQGVFPLPEAQLDRFLVKVSLGFPSLEEEAGILRRFRSGERPEQPQPVISPEQLREMRQLCRSVRVSKDVETYLLELVRKTREPKAFLTGASPRAALALLALSQSLAWLDGRDFVTPDDIKRGVVPVLSHRVQLPPERRAKGETETSALQDLLGQIPVPVELQSSSH
ncbi:AAA family ATPase [Paenibacillus thermotolerans]|uniref:AAA family ATPase n=1 Tax=Paenibacillus thermotolerans TaxID=3027807 RepID=UPI00236861E1|nr:MULTISPECIES: MoxR family ATPase [unclassified Paenibacillus]